MDACSGDIKHIELSDPSQVNTKADIAEEHSNDLLAEELRKDCKVYQAADGLRHVVLPELPYNTIIQRADVLAAAEVEIENPTLQEITCMKANLLLGASQASDWAECVWPLQELGDESLEWAVAKPLLRLCSETLTFDNASPWL
jgi:hypothetical protein